MKKYLVISAAIAAAALVLLPNPAAAQRWDMNVYGGWSYSNLSGGSTTLADGNYTSRFGAGAGAELRLNEDWGWEFGLWYIQKGTQGTFTASPSDPAFFPQPNQTFDGNVNLDYVEVPILVNVYFPVGDKANVRGYIGPTFSFMTSAKVDGTLDGQSTNQDISDKLDDADFTIMIGAGGEWHLSRVDLLLDFRWDWGLTNITKVDGVELRNSTVLITAGVGFSLTKEEE